jgi:hypothetical protein
MEVDLIYCAGGNEQLSDIALEEGWKLGVRSDLTSYHKVDFVDVDYKNPDFEAHLKRVIKERPKYATVPDLSDEHVLRKDVNCALMRYELLKPYCEVVYIVPKLYRQLPMLPLEIPIGYSVPTTYGGAKFTPKSLKNRKIHLLGGSPHAQLDIFKILDSLDNTVLSVDGNMAQRMAIEFCKYWKFGGVRATGQWVKYEVGKPKQGEAPQYFECFRRSARNIKAAWQQITSIV